MSPPSTGLQTSLLRVSLNSPCEGFINGAKKTHADKLMEAGLGEDKGIQWEYFCPRSVTKDVTRRRASIPVTCYSEQEQRFGDQPGLLCASAIDHSLFPVTPEQWALVTRSI